MQGLYHLIFLLHRVFLQINIYKRYIRYYIVNITQNETNNYFYEERYNFKQTAITVSSNMFLPNYTSSGYNWFGRNT
ncbi:hypothetical protein KL86DYS1_31269 [uncultured Dysgonomonas sp.]|uniref:Uncharacterized protein n=1 Tax=uncultured Dysgonomonas sp. TaxID=206096 RepID=A0A212K2V3_9BACT|nr:hypothetical protein KL86DYS1_31269 [uncultured Dysgonomonas sp.]